MSWKDTAINNTGTSIKYGADDMELVSRLFNGVTTGIPAVTIKSNNKWGFWDGVLYIRNQADTKNMTIRGPVTMTNDFDLTMPSITGNDTLPAIGLANVWGVKQQFESGMLIKQMSDPANPSSNYHHLYADSSGHLIRKNSSGVTKDYDVNASSLPLDISALSMALRDYNARVFKVDSTYYAVKHDGTLIDSGSVFEVVLQAAIDLTGDILVGGLDTSIPEEFLFTSTGVTMSDNDIGTNLIILKNASLVIPNGSSITAIHMLNCSYSNIDLYGYIYEAGTPVRNGKGIVLEAENGESCSYNCINFNGGMIFDVDTCIEIKATSSGFTQANTINQAFFQNFKKGIVWNSISSGPCGGNIVNSAVIQCAPYTTHGVKDVDNGGDDQPNDFIGCHVWDLPGGAIGINIKSGGFVKITGGDIKYNPANDLSTATEIHDNRNGILTNKNILVRHTGSTSLDLYRTDGATDTFHGIAFNAPDSAGNKTKYADVFAYINDDTNGSEDGAFGVNVQVAGADKNVLFCDAAEGLSYSQDGDIYGSITTQGLTTSHVYNTADEDGTFYTSLRDYSARVYKIGSTYYARKYDGTMIDSGSVFETVLQAAIDENAGDIIIGGYDSAQEYLFSTTGVVLSDQNVGTNLIIMKNASLAVPNGFTGTAIHVHNGAYTNITLSGFIYEVGWDTNSEDRLWTAVLYEADNGDSCVYNSFYSKGGQIFAVGTGVKLKQTGTGFTNGNAFYNLNISDMTVGVELEQNGGTDKIQGNYFSDNLLQCDADTEYGYKNVSGGGNFLSNCYVWDPQGAVGVNLLSTSGDGNTIVGGNVKYDPANDANVNTQVFDQWWTILGNNLHIYSNRTVAQLTTDQNNFALGDDVNKIEFFMSSNASRNITGLHADMATYMRVIILHNTGSQNIVLKHENASSTATNRFKFPSAADVTLAPACTVWLQYDGEVNNRWILLGKNF